MSLQVLNSPFTVEEQMQAAASPSPAPNTARAGQAVTRGCKGITKLFSPMEWPCLILLPAFVTSATLEVQNKWEKENLMEKRTNIWCQTLTCRIQQTISDPPWSIYSKFSFTQNISERKTGWCHKRFLNCCGHLSGLAARDRVLSLTL